MTHVDVIYHNGELILLSFNYFTCTNLRTVLSLLKSFKIT
jgi:hypothetical protein